MKYVIKRDGKHQAFDKNKLKKSLHAACLSVHEKTEVANATSDIVTKDVESWMEQKDEVSSNDIRLQAGAFLKKINPHAGYLYLHHRIMW